MRVSRACGTAAAGAGGAAGEAVGRINWSQRDHYERGSSDDDDGPLNVDTAMLNRLVANIQSKPFGADVRSSHLIMHVPVVLGVKHSVIVAEECLIRLLCHLSSLFRFPEARKHSQRVSSNMCVSSSLQKPTLPPKRPPKPVDTRKRINIDDVKAFYQRCQQAALEGREFDIAGETVRFRSPHTWPTRSPAFSNVLKHTDTPTMR